MATDGQLDDLLGELRAGGEVDSQGRFTLDRAQARAKMQKFQLADARRYVLELVQAAVLRGATTIAFDIDADDMHMRCDGESFAAAELDDLWGSIFADGDGADLRGLRQLALGLNAALGMDPKRIVVRSGGHQLTVQPGKDDALAAIDPPAAGFTIHVQQRARIGLVVDFFRNLGGSLGEERHLRERCRYSTIPITLDRVPIVVGLRGEDVLGEQPIAADGVKGVVAFVRHDRPSELRLVKDGVWIDSVPLEECGPGFVAVVAGDQLRKDVSLAKIVADDALAEIVGLVRAARWGALMRAVEAVERREIASEPTMQRVRAEVLKFLKLRDIRKRPDAALLAGAIAWPDARSLDPEDRRRHRWISLAELAPPADSEGATGTLRFAYLDYPYVAPDGPPVPRLGEKEAQAVARILGYKRQRIDDELARANARELARRAFLRRTMEPKLCDRQRSYATRAAIEAEGLRGEVGLAGAARTDGTVWLLREGCLLARFDLAWGIAGLDVALEAAFTPADSYEDVARDAALVRAFMHVLAGLAGPLAQLYRERRGTELEGDARGRIKAWLSLVLVGDARDELWRALATTVLPSDAEVAAILPTPAQVLAGDGVFGELLDVALFEDFGGARRSLRELAERRARLGALDELDRAEVPREPGFSGEVLWLGRGDRKLLVGLFGEAAVCSYKHVLEGMRAEQAFRARPERPLAAAARELDAGLRAAGLDPLAWRRTIAEGGVEAVITPARGAERSAIELLVDGRTMTTRALELGLPMVGAASSPDLQPNGSWIDVVGDAGLHALEARLRAAAWELVGELVRHHAELGEAREWLVARVLGVPDAVRQVPGLGDVPLLATLDRGTLSLAGLEAVLREHEKIGWVPLDTPARDLGDPPILRDAPPVIAALQRRYGEEKIVDGRERVRLHGLSAQIQQMPVVERVALDPVKVWFAASLSGGTPKLEGEIGIARAREGTGLLLELCTAGRRIGVATEADVPLPLEAILADPELPLTSLCAIDTRSKRYGHYVKRCRRAVPGLVTALCGRFGQLAADDRERVRALLLGYAEREAANATRSEPRERAWAAVSALPLLVDAWGRAHSLASVVKRASRGVVDVVSGPVEVDGEAAPADRLILVVDPPARRCLAALIKLRDIDERWAEERAALRELAQAPEVALPDLREVAWIDRKATVSGGLEAHLWISRTPGEGDALVFVRGKREVGRLALLAGVPCAGIVTGDGMTVRPGGVELDARQRASLARQVCVLVETLAGQVKSSGKMSASERERAKAWLIEVGESIADEPLLRELGKPFERLRAALRELAPPTLRKAKGRKAEPVAKVEPAKVEAAKVEAAKVEPEPEVVLSPEQRFIGIVRAELEWARARHGELLEKLGLDRLALGTDNKAGIVHFDRGIVLHRRHPLVARQIDRLAAGGEPEPIDMAFLVSAIYTLMNEVAQEIDATDEQAYVARLAESLALALR